MSDYDRWHDDRREREARDTAWRAEDRRPPNNPDLEASRGYTRNDDGRRFDERRSEERRFAERGRRDYGAGDFEGEHRERDEHSGYSRQDRGPVYAGREGGRWPAYDPGREGPAAHDYTGPEWRGGWRQEPPWSGQRQDRSGRPGEREMHSPWLGRDPNEVRREEHRGEERSFWDRTRDEVASWFGGEERRGEHRGRGPRGYRRSDERIREDVNDRLTDDAWLDASDIEVRVHGGEVVLDGRVASRDDKRRAEDIAERVSGVAHVQNNLRLREGRREDGRRPEDDWTGPYPAL